MGDVLIDYPRRHRFVYEDITGAYLAHHPQISKAWQIAPLYPSLGASLPRKRGSSLFYGFGLLGGGGHLWWVGHLGAL